MYRGKALGSHSQKVAIYYRSQQDRSHQKPTLQAPGFWISSFQKYEKNKFLLLKPLSLLWQAEYTNKTHPNLGRSGGVWLTATQKTPRLHMQISPPAPFPPGAVRSPGREGVISKTQRLSHPAARHWFLYLHN